MPTPFDSDPITITKLEAARRQLGTAIKLWFEEGDDVSILTLSYASHEIIHRLYRQAGHENLLYDSNIIKDEFRPEYAKLLKEAPNFIKHASNENADSSITFRPGLSAVFLMMSIYAINKMSLTLNQAEHALFIWFGFHNPAVAFLQNITDKGFPIEAIERLKTRGRKDFYQQFVKLRAKT